MRLLIINPNISESVTELIAKEARRTASKDTELSFETASFGVEYIETRSEALIGGYAVLNILAERHTECDAAVIAAFGDPGLAAAQEIMDIPVVGLSNSAFMMACLTGNRFSIIAISKRIVPWYYDCVVANGLTSRLASIKHLPETLSGVADIQDVYRKELQILCHTAVEDDGADAIVLAGAPLAGLAEKLRVEIPVPLIDGVSSAVRAAEGLVSLGFHKPRGSRQSSLPSKAQSALSPALAALMTKAAAPE